MKVFEIASAAIVLLGVLTVRSTVVAAADETTPPPRPNVLFIAVDDLNDWIGPNGAGGHPQVQTPNLDKLVKRGIYFTNAHCTAAVCGASRFSLLSGMRPSTSGYYVNGMGDNVIQQDVIARAQMLPAYLRTQGYKTMGGGKVFHKGTRCRFPSDDWDETLEPYRDDDKWRKQAHGYGRGYFLPFPRGGSPLRTKLNARNGFSLCGGPLDEQDIPNGVMADVYHADWAAKKLGEAHDKPFFLAVGFARPHVPYTCPRKYFDRYDRDKILVPPVAAGEMKDIPLFGKAIAHGMFDIGDEEMVVAMGPDYRRDLIHAYLACVSFVDDQIGRVIAALDRSDHADNTIIVLWTDHGQNFGEKRIWRKQCLWEESTRVPLLVAFPDGRQAGKRCGEAVSLLDVAPTVLDLCGLPPLKTHEGASLGALFANPAGTRRQPAVSSWYHGNHAVRDERWRYIRYRDGGAELYDHQNDPGEHHNLAGRAEHAAVIERLAKWIPQDPPLPEGKTAPDDLLQRRVNKWTADPATLPDWLK